MDSKQHLDNVWENKLRPIFEKARARIDALKYPEKIPATTLAADLAKEIGMTGPQLYPTLKFLFDGYPGVEVKKGAHGGISPLPPPSTATTSADSSADSTDEVLDNDNQE